MTFIHPRRLIRHQLDRAISQVLRAPAEQFVNLWDDGFDPCGWQRGDDDAAFPPVHPPDPADRGLLEALQRTTANDNVQLRLLSLAAELQRDRAYR